MRPTTLALVLATLVVGVASCGDGKDANRDGDGGPNGDPLLWNGIYRVISHTRNETACVQEGPEIQGGYAFFELEERTIANFAAVVFIPCAQIDACDPDPTDAWFQDERSGEWGGAVEGKTCSCPSICTGDCCTINVQLTIGNLQRASDTAVLIETREKEGTVMAPVCDQEIADDDPALTCVAFEVLRGELVK